MSDILTRKQAKRAVKSIAYRRRLNKHLTELENKIKTLLVNKEKSKVRLGRYIVELDNEDLLIHETEPIDLNQLTFEFIENGDIPVIEDKPKIDQYQLGI